jgi:hypothetical protein
MEEEWIMRRVPHVAKDSTKRGPTHVENLGVQLHESLQRFGAEEDKHVDKSHTSVLPLA